MVQDDEPSLYLYRLPMDGHEQTGVARLLLGGRVRHRSHQEAREDAQGQGRRPHASHRRAARANRRGVPDLSRVDGRRHDWCRACHGRAPLYDLTAPDGVRHAVWRVVGRDCDALVAAVRGIPALYIADGHHRAASAARASARTSAQGGPGQDDARRRHSSPSPSPTLRCRSCLYNRIVKDLAGQTAESL